MTLCEGDSARGRCASLPGYGGLCPAPAGLARASTADRPRAASGTGPERARKEDYRLSHVRAASGALTRERKVLTNCYRLLIV